MRAVCICRHQATTMATTDIGYRTGTEHIDVSSDWQCTCRNASIAQEQRNAARRACPLEEWWNCGF